MSVTNLDIMRTHVQKNRSRTKYGRAKYGRAKCQDPIHSNERRDRNENFGNESRRNNQMGTISIQPGYYKEGSKKKLRFLKLNG